MADLAWAPDGSEARLLAAAPLRAGLRLSGAIGCLGASHESLLLGHGPEAVAAAAAAGAPALLAGCAAQRPWLHVRAVLALCAPSGRRASPRWTLGCCNHGRSPRTRGAGWTGLPPPAKAV